MTRLVRILALIIGGLLLPLSLSAQREHYQNYINQYMVMAVEQMERYKIPASITLAQGLLESNAGQSRLATEGKNHFGIKCGGSWTGPYMLVNDDAPNEHFRVYKSVRDSYVDHSLFLTSNRRYAGLFSLKIHDYRGWARGLKAAGYATNPRYADILIQLIEDYGLAQIDHYSLSNIQRNASKGDEYSMLHEVYMCNHNFYTIAEPGDTYKAIAKEMDVSERKLRKYNEVDKRYKLQIGDIVYFQKKQKKADKQYKDVYHIMKEGESLYDLAQRYGMRVKTLYDINHLSPDYVPAVGELVLIRK
ncbi:MAG: glucosaminidase domain-containing protein [Bacteroidaceae bacterium]|nr:glucosaminidase domain-containing protein [Bacteroidaceae bacterium]